MKRFFKAFWLLMLVIVALVYLAARSHATDFPVAHANNTLNLTLMSVTTSNKTSVSESVEMNLNHTFQFLVLCTNAVSNVISGSLDGSSWTPLHTNSASASTTNAATLSGHWAYFRDIFTVTTANGSTNTVLYLGGK